MIIDYTFLAYFAISFGLLHVLARKEAVKKFINRHGKCREGKRWDFLPRRNNLIATFLLWTVGAFLVGFLYLETKNYWTNPLHVVIYFALMGLILLAVRVIADSLPLGRLVVGYSSVGWCLFMADASWSSSLILEFIDLMELYNPINYTSLFQGIDEAFILLLLVGAILMSEYISYYLWKCFRQKGTC